MNRICVSAFLLFVIVGCAHPPAPMAPVASGAKASFVDDTGRSISVSKSPLRIVSLTASNTEIVYALGLGDRLVGSDQDSNYPPEVAKKPRVGGCAAPDMEHLVALNPDIVLGSTLQTKAIIDQITGYGIPVFVVNANSVDGVISDVRKVGELLGVKDRADKLAGSLEAEVKAVEASTKGTPKQKVFVELSADLYTCGKKTFLADMVRRAGGDNLGDRTDREWPQISLESLVTQNPDVIVLTDSAAGVTADQVRNREGWRDMAAVKDNRIAIVDQDVTCRPGPRMGQGLRQLAKALKGAAR